MPRRTRAAIAGWAAFAVIMGCACAVVGLELDPFDEIFLEGGRAMWPVVVVSAYAVACATAAAVARAPAVAARRALLLAQAGALGYLAWRWSWDPRHAGCVPATIEMVRAAVRAEAARPLQLGTLATLVIGLLHLATRRTSAAWTRTTTR
jgi:hypothetical protein